MYLGKMDLEAASVESTAEGDWLNMATSDGEVFTFRLTEDSASQIIDAVREWLRESKESK